MKKYILLLILLNACVSWPQPEVWEHENSYTLRLYTGRFGEDIYEKNFETKAKELCPKGYSVIEKSFKPTTLHKNNYDSSHYNWVIKCL